MPTKIPKWPVFKFWFQPTLKYLALCHTSNFKNSYNNFKCNMNSNNYISRPIFENKFLHKCIKSPDKKYETL